jgi:hypothetical protein
MHLESLILNILLKDKAYLDKSIHYLQSDYFSSRPEKVVFECIKEFYEKYQKAPTADILKLSVDELVGLSDDEFKLTKDTLKSAVADQYEYDLKWMFDSTEKFCQEKAVYNAIMKSVKIISGDDKKTPMGAIPELLQSALAVTFDSKTGHDYFREHKRGMTSITKVKSEFRAPLISSTKSLPMGFQEKLSVCSWLQLVVVNLQSCHLCRATSFVRDKMSYTSRSN